VKHNSGFFSCCSVRLYNIIKFFNKNKRLPESVDSSEQFKWYKINKHGDLTFDYFLDYNTIDNKIIYTSNIDFYVYGYVKNSQFLDYNKLDYNNILPFINKYFSISDEIKQIIIDIENKYNLDYNNICVLFYRGNDKNRETSICSYDEYIKKAQYILRLKPDIIFLIQSDETQFIDKMLLTLPNNSIYFKDYIRHINKCNNTVDKVFKNENYIYSRYFLAITVIMSRCKYVVCGSGNCSLWIMLYRKNTNNVYQYLNGKWLQ